MANKSNKSIKYQAKEKKVTKKIQKKEDPAKKQGLKQQLNKNLSSNQNQNIKQKQQQPQKFKKNQYKIQKLQNNSKNQQIQQKQQQNKNQIQNQQQLKRKQFTEEQIDTYINRQKLKKSEKKSKEIFLGKEGAFSEFKILVSNFHDFLQEGEFDETAGQELLRKGFQYDIERDFDTFVSKMMNYDIVWLISSYNQRSQKQQKNLITEIGKFFKAKKSLYLWCDNTPYHVEADIILQKYFNGMHMKGDYYGCNAIYKEIAEDGYFDEIHSIGYGLNSIHEGITICSPQNIHPDFKHFAYNSKNEPLVSYAEENENHGRIIIDCGFTKLQKNYWVFGGTAQYVSNANVWLTGIPK